MQGETWFSLFFVISSSWTPTLLQSGCCKGRLDDGSTNLWFGAGGGWDQRNNTQLHAEDVTLDLQFSNSFVLNGKLLSNLLTNPTNALLTGRNKPTERLSWPCTFNTLNYLTKQHNVAAVCCIIVLSKLFLYLSPGGMNWIHTHLEAMALIFQFTLRICCLYFSLNIILHLNNDRASPIIHTFDSCQC